jgi:hypothetical protein
MSVPFRPKLRRKSLLRQAGTSAESRQQRKPLLDAVRLQRTRFLVQQLGASHGQRGVIAAKCVLAIVSTTVIGSGHRSRLLRRAE